LTASPAQNLWLPMASACLQEVTLGPDQSEGTALGQSRGFIARVPNQEPRFIPIPSCLRLCSLSQVAEHVRQAVFSALVGDEDLDAHEVAEDEEETDEEEVRLTKEKESPFRVLFRERDLEDASTAAAFLGALASGHFCIVRVLFRLLGGKGGFGALLRGQKGRGKKTTNLDAMRDLSGRRLRHSKAVERIKSWMEDHRREDDLVAALTAEGPELPKPTPKAEILDAEYVRKLKQGAALKSKLVSQGMRRLQTEGSNSSAAAAAGNDDDECLQEAKKRSRHEGSNEGNTRARKYFGALSALEGLSSPDDDEQEDLEEELPMDGASGASAADTVANTGAASSSCAAAACSSSSSSSSGAKAERLTGEANVAPGAQAAVASSAAAAAEAVLH